MSTKDKWLSIVAKSGEYNDLVNKPKIVSNIQLDASENSLASAKSVKDVYNKADEALNKANESKTKIATSLNSMGVLTDENDTFESLSEKIKTIKTGVNTDDATATADKILNGNSAYVKGEKIEGGMKNLSESSMIMHEQGNPTKVIQADDLFIGNNTDGKKRLSLRYSGENGFITGNTLFGLEESIVAGKLGITPNKIVKGQSICGINGNATLIDANNGVSKIQIKDLFIDSIIPKVKEKDKILCSIISTADAYYAFYISDTFSSNKTKYYVNVYKYDKNFNKQWGKEIGELYSKYSLVFCYSPKFNRIFIGGTLYYYYIVQADGTIKSIRATYASYPITAISFSDNYLSVVNYEYVRLSPIDEKGNLGNEVKLEISKCYLIDTIVTNSSLFIFISGQGLVRYNINNSSIDSSSKTLVTADISSKCMIKMHENLIYTASGQNVNIYNNIDSNPTLFKSLNVGLTPNSLLINNEDDNKFIYGLNSDNGGTLSKTNVETGEIVFIKNLSSDGYAGDLRLNIAMDTDTKLLITNPDTLTKWIQYVNI